MNTLLKDLTYAFRGLAKNPGFALAAVLSLMIGIGANTTIFSVTSALFLNPLPYKDAGRLTILWNRSPGLNITQDWFSTAQYFDVKNTSKSFEDVAIAIGGVQNLTGNGEPERVGAILVSSNLLPMLGAHAEHGRLFNAQDDVPGGAGVAILGHGTWLRRYGADPRVIGKSLTMNGKTYQIVGVLPGSFSLPREVMPTLDGAEDAEVLLPLPMAADAASNRGHEDYNIVAKLRPGVTARQAQAEMDTLTARLRHDFPDLYPPNGGLTFGVVPLLEQVVGDVRMPLRLMSGAVGLVLLIACVNVANLLLSRALARQKEIAIRAALGASRKRLLRQLLTESVALALLGGVLGVLFSALSLQLVRVLGAKRIPRLHEIAINGEVLLFTLGLSILAGIIFGLAPALRVCRRDVQSNLQDASRGSSGASAVWGRGNNLRRLLVIAELALSVVVLVAAGLLIRSFARLQNVSPGFNSNGVLTLELTMSGRRYGDKQAVLQTYHQLWERLERLPGVSSAGAVSHLPLSQMFAWGPITVEGRAPAPGENFINADIRIAAGHYFEAMQIPLLKGRLLNDQDTPDSPRVAVVDEYMAQQMWPGQDALGKRFHFGGLNDKANWIIVVGIVGRIKQYTLDADSRIAYYVPQTQYPVRAMNVVLRSGSAPAALTSAVRSEIHELDSDLPLYNVLTMQQRVAASLAERRFSMTLLSMFALFALGLASVGTYSVISYLVNQGTREIGIRMALGATPRSILNLVLQRGMLMTLIGVGAGALLALAAARFMRSLLFGIGVADPLTFAAITGLLAFVTLLAIFFPARRAARTDPMISLRCE
ncbi:MAG: ABC transporter permease [Acidobacteriia bacterium]|nr:ABC transporter permease [Terriglobia bacterium]